MRIIKLSGVGVGLLALLATGLSGGASALPADIGTPVITHYGLYPSPTVSGAVAGCSQADIVGSTFTLNPDTSASPPTTNMLEQFSRILHVGDVVRWTWDSVTEKCGSSWVSFGLKEAKGDAFDRSVDQFLDASVGIDGPGPGPNHLDIKLTGLDKGCFFQVDAILGLPLADVGPSGSYYNNVTRGDDGPNMLVSASNGHYGESCQGTDTTVPSSQPTITVPPPTITVPPPTITVPPPTITVPPPTTPIVEGPPLTVVEPEPTTTTIVTTPTTPTTPTTATTVTYVNCDDVRAHGAAPLQIGQPGYRAGLDGDSDGVACEDGDTVPPAVVSSPVPDQGELAVTGRPVNGMVALATVFLGLGLAALAPSWRRRSSF